MEFRPMMKDYRLQEHDSHLVDRSKKVTITFDGKPIQAYQGETVASALYAAGVRIFSRSFKYHRPRGLLCVSGKCPNCLMNVDGRPNVRTCTEPVHDGKVVRHQNAWPSLNRDLFSLLDRLDRFLPVGFYYKTLIRPRWLWRLAEPIIRRLAGLGRIDIHAIPEERYEHLYRHADVTVVGGGPAGMTAAIEAARLGVRVTLIDDQPSLGGHLRTQARSYDGIPEYAGLSGFQIAEKLAQAVQASPNIEVLSNATAFGFYEGNLLGVLQGRRLVKVRSQRTVMATGCHEVPLVFLNNDLPGVFLGVGVQRLMHLYGVRPGERALVVTTNDSGYTVAADLLKAGASVAAVADSRPSTPEHLEEAQELRAAGVPLLAPYTVKEAHGSKHVTGATVARLDEGGVLGEERRLSCNMICVSAGFQPAASLLYQAGCQLGYDTDLGEPVPQELAPAVYAAGDITGIHDLHATLLQGRIAGIEAVSSLPGKEEHDVSQALEPYRRKLEEVEGRYREGLQAIPPLTVPHPGKKKFVCFCEDVTEKDLGDAVAEGFGDMELLKRYSTVSMGPCQGKMCLAAAIGICARETGRSIQETGTTTSRPPIQPVPLGALAGPSHMPVRLTPMDRKHIQLGARMMDLGQWRRPHSYGLVEEEYLAVRQRVGLIDVSTLGKLDVRGKDAARFLDKVYVNTHSNLRIGRTRYGVICSDSGVILDDGTVSRLSEDHFFITTTSGNVELVEEWFKWWVAGTEMCVHITNVTSGFAAMNVAGPKARDVLSKLTDIDLTSSAFRYMRNAQGMVAGVLTIMMRIGFVGETGWEMHFPAEYGEYMWDVLVDAGREYGIAPFGLEAQRVLRLEKKHIIVGQDTDAVSNPLEGDMAWVVKFDKEDFIGKAGLLEVQQRGHRDRLVGFVMRDAAVPEDGDPVVADGRPVGRVTSSRFSPTLGRGFGMAWVPAQMAEDDSEIRIMVDGRAVAADVVAQPFYDPEGKRLRE